VTPGKREGGRGESFLSSINNSLKILSLLKLLSNNKKFTTYHKTIDIFPLKAFLLIS
jgi:hypothetical protein